MKKDTRSNPGSPTEIKSLKGKTPSKVVFDGDFLCLSRHTPKNPYFLFGGIRGDINTLTQLFSLFINTDLIWNIRKSNAPFFSG